MAKYLWTSTKIILVIEVCLFGYHCWFGKHGLSMVSAIQIEQQSIALAIGKVSQEIAQLDQEINNWHKYPFYQEKIAREELHMAGKDDEVYFIT